MSADARGDVHRTLDATWRIESGRIIAGVARIVRDVNVAEELAQHALLAALEQWPTRGIPDNPGAWLTTAAKRRAIDLFRHRAMTADKEPQLVDDARAHGAAPERDLDDDVGDDLLRLIFTACHPVLAADARAALTLRMVGGLSTAEVARAFLVPEATMAQRIVRAKRALADARVPFQLPRAAERKARLSSVLEVIYLIFNEGYAATAGDDWMRPGLCEDALRLGRILARLTPDEAEVHGLVALMELTASRNKARVTSTGEPVLLLEQNRGRWDRLLMGRGLV
ncbi:MAG TPA: DUF6596 domain-containing protein, partial [Myxococcota bacterium]